MVAPQPVAKETITVRMYRGILGDCFLLIHEHNGDINRLLIDCGVLQGVAGAKNRMVEIARDIARTCGNVLDLVVVTHEHHDHLSGFNYARDIFFAETLTIKRLWLAWTENPVDEQARRLRQRFTKAKTALALAAGINGESAFGASEVRRRQLETVRALTNFIGPIEGSGLEAAGAMTGAKVLDLLKTKVGAEGTRYLEPGQCVRVRGDDGLRAFVLGPPRSEERLRKDRPSAGSAKEVYLTVLDDAFAVESVARAKLAVQSSGNRDEVADSNELVPFARPHQRSIEAARNDETSTHEGETKPSPEPDVEELYFDPENKARAIDDDWFDAAETLALKLDSDTNNTSLVLAFELSDGQVLLFPGDAQVGNWLSWRDQTYSRKDMDGPLPVDELLRRVTLYKVGHHASHNATLRKLGLEKMTDPRLIAMIPVVEEIARQQGESWKMPYGPLYDELMHKTSGRVLAR